MKDGLVATFGMVGKVLDGHGRWLKISGQNEPSSCLANQIKPLLDEIHNAGVRVVHVLNDLPEQQDPFSFEDLSSMARHLLVQVCFLFSELQRSTSPFLEPCCSVGHDLFGLFVHIATNGIGEVGVQTLEQVHWVPPE